ncbi:MAG TPA: hypothetical protein VLV86_06800 [Vicinamibacterales bacterium]|nr:hypothetical protein [Vicinamibacterales bacterium]
MSVLHLFIALLLLQSVPSADRRPLALSEIDDSARYLFDAARDSRWTAAQDQLQTLQQALEDLPTGIRPTDEATSLRRRVHELADMVASKDRVRTMDAANAITQSVIGLSVTFQSRVPSQIPRLGYLGRQVELGVATNNRTLITRAVADIRQAWNELQPELEGRGHRADVRRMTDIVVTLEGATQLNDDDSLARAELGVVSHLEAELK